VSGLKVQLLNPSLISSYTAISSTASTLINCTISTTTNLTASYRCLTTSVSGANDRYYLKIGLEPSPTASANVQYFQFVVTSFFNTTNITNGTADGSSSSRTLFRGTEVIRNTVVKVIYIK